MPADNRLELIRVEGFREHTNGTELFFFDRDDGRIQRLKENRSVPFLCVLYQIGVMELRARVARASHGRGNAAHHPAAALTGVSFGPDIDNESMEIVCLILAGQHESVKLYRGSRGASELRVQFEEFTYTS